MRSSDASRESLQELSSDHEEANTRIVFHARDAAVRGYHQVNVLCRDTDVLVLLLAHRQCSPVHTELRVGESSVVPSNLKVLAKFGLCSNCSQKLDECSLDRACKTFANARMLVKISCRVA